MLIKIKSLFPIVLILLVALSFLLVVGCKDSPEEVKRREEIKKEELSRSGLTVKELVPMINYFRDDRTDLCFAYYREYDFHGGPAMACVPCEKVKDFLPPSQRVTVHWFSDEIDAKEAEMRGISLEGLRKERDATVGFSTSKGGENNVR